MNKKDSIFFQITLFFVTICVIINIIVIIQFILDNKANEMFHIKRYFESVDIIREGHFKKLTDDEINEKLKPYYTSIANIDRKELEKTAKKIFLYNDFPMNIYSLNNIKYINPKGHKPPERFKQKDKFFMPPPKKDDFFEPFLKDKEIIFIDRLKDSYIKSFWLIILFIIDFLLIWFFYFLYKKLKPLQKLKNEIVKFSTGDLDINTKVIGKDEIAQVSNEFNNAIKKIRDLNDSRKLFLRNILHELKTPITKGKLISDTLEQSKRKSILQKAFLRLEYLLEEFVKLEELTSGKLTLYKKEYRIVDLLDQALDLLMLDKSKINIQYSSTKINVDYEVFSIALKNLIDNAMRYKTQGIPEIIIKEHSILIKNQGKALKKDFENYLKPFNREYESIDKGLGLGLYITKNIIETHGYSMNYYYNNDFHIIEISFNSNLM